MTVCMHCDEPAAFFYYQDDDVAKARPFCCQGCMTVYSLIHQKGLGTYYEIKKDSATFKRRAAVDAKELEFNFLDERDFIKDFAYQDIHGDLSMDFYLEGIHCLACLWLIEKMPEFLPFVAHSRLDLERSVAKVSLKEGGKFSEVARELNHLGYRPHPLKKDQNSELLKRKEEQSQLIKIGIAGAATGNIMLYAVSLYGGADGEYEKLFNLLTVLFALPVMTYCASSFYKNAWIALKNKSLSIDVPIAMALLIGAIMGLYNLIVGVHENYFDSLTGLVFLLLLSRYFLQKIQERALNTKDLHYFYQNESILKAEDSSLETFKEVHPKFLEIGNIIKVKFNEFFPVDGIILEGASLVNNSLLTGEAEPVRIAQGDTVYQGTQNLGQELIVKVEKVQSQTRLGHILKKTIEGMSHKAPIVTLTNQVSKYFILTVFVLSAILFLMLYLQGDTRLAIERAITLLIVTCPCALALAVPLTFNRALSLASEQGIIIKNDEVVEKLSKIKNIFLDKTGTITFGKLKVENITVLAPSHFPIEQVMLSLEELSKHPVAMAIKEYYFGKKVELLKVENFIERLGVGVAGHIGDYFYEIKQGGVFENGKLIATLSLKDVIRPDTQAVINDLKKQDYSIKVLSGDRQNVVGAMAQSCGLDTNDALGELSPEAKSDMIKNTPFSMMVGDGANDAIALGQASVGVAVLGAMDLSLKAADVYLTTPGLVPIQKLLILSQEVMKVIKRNLVLSICYNFISVVAVFLGFINPLVAAIIMPVSSLTVLISTVVGTKKMRSLWRS